MSIKKSPFQVINLAQMPLDVVRQRAALEKLKAEKKDELEIAKETVIRKDLGKPEFKMLGSKNLFTPDSNREDEGEQILLGKTSKQEPEFKDTQFIYPVSDFKSVFIFLIKCSILAGVVKWTYDVGVWGSTSETSKLAAVFTNQVQRVAKKLVEVVNKSYEPKPLIIIEDNQTELFPNQLKIEANTNKDLKKPSIE